MIIQEANRLSFVKEYYFSKKLREVRAMIAEGKPVINLGIGNPDLSPAETTINKMVESVKQNDNHGYQPYKGLPELRKAMSDWYHSTYHVDLNPDTEILPLLGSKEGINHISQAFINEGNTVLVPNPGYPSYGSATRLAGGNPEYYELNENDDWAPDWEKLGNRLLDDTKIWWVNYPNMPTGAAPRKDIFEKIVSIARKHKILVVNDNPYSLVLNKKDPSSIFQIDGSKEVCLELNSLSKSHNMAGWRIGMLAGAAGYVDAVLKVKSNIDSGMFKPVQLAAIEAMKTGDEWHQSRNDVYKERRKLAYRIMDEIGCTYSKESVGMFIWGKIPEQHKNVEVLTEKILHEANVFLTPGVIFGSGGDRYIRISLCSKEAALMESLERIKQLELNN